MATVTPLLNELMSHLWALWIIIAAVAAILEMVLPSFSFILASVAALIAALVAFKVGLAGQIAIFSAVLVLSLLLVRPRLLKKLNSAKEIPTRSQALVGRHAQVTEAIDPVTHAGRVLAEGQDWAAQSAGPIAAGKTVVVEGADGIVLKVREI